MKFREKLRELREGAGLTQQQLADKAGLTLHSVRNHEQGQRNPSWTAVVRLSRALGVPTDTFTGCDLEDEAGGEKAPAKAAARPKRNGVGRGGQKPRG